MSGFSKNIFLSKQPKTDRCTLCMYLIPVYSYLYLRFSDTVNSTLAFRPLTLSKGITHKVSVKTSFFALILDTRAFIFIVYLHISVSHNDIDVKIRLYFQTKL